MAFGGQENLASQPSVDLIQYYVDPTITVEISPTVNGTSCQRGLCDTNRIPSGNIYILSVLSQITENIITCYLTQAAACWEEKPIVDLEFVLTF